METNTTTERMYRVLGTTEDAPSNGCEHCGRPDLKVYVALEPTEGGPIVYFGTTCAAKAERIPVAVIRGEAKAADQAVRDAENAARRAAAKADHDRYCAWLQVNYGVAQPSDLHDLKLSPVAVLNEYRDAA